MPVLKLDKSGAGSAPALARTVLGLSAAERVLLILPAVVLLWGAVALVLGWGA